MKLAVIAAMALAALAAADTASAAARNHAWQGRQVGIGKGAADRSLSSRKVIPLRANQPTHTGQKTQGIIMRDGGVCDPIRHMGC
jgi:opacity protein-like surface antigen